MPEPPGPNCQYGGTKIESGLDTNGDGILEPFEVTSTSYVCNGAPGEAGAPGAVSLINVIPLPVGSMQCPAGGQEIETGVDTNGNGVLDPSEVQDVAFVCNGVAGQVCPSPTSLCISNMGGTLYCANTSNDIHNCGACNAACSTNNATASCTGGMCALTCAAGFADCNANPADGCETNITSNVNDCGACGMSCANPNNAVAGCSGGVCTETCNPGFAHCSANPADGCETNLVTDVNNCGACGNACSTNNAVPTCAGSACHEACKPTFVDCDMNPANGCEALQTPLGSRVNPLVVGPIVVGASPIPISGNLLTVGEENWLAVAFTGNSDPNYHPTVQLTGNPNNAFLFDVYSDVGAPATTMSCGDGGNSLGRTAWEEFYPPGQFDPTGQTAQPVVVGSGGTVFIRVYQDSAPPAPCGTYVLSISNL